MYPFIIIFILLLLGLKNNISSKYYWFCCAILFLLVAFRGVNVGVDTPTYHDEFYFGVDRPTEPLWTLYIKFIGSITDDFQVFLFITALLCVLPVFLFIKKESPLILLSLFLYFVLPNDQGYIFIMSALRQSLAISIVLWWYVSVKQKKWLFCIILPIISFLVHNSSIIAVLVFCISLLLKINKKVLYLILAICTIFSFVSLSISDIFDVLAGSSIVNLAFLEDYSSYATYLVGEFQNSFFDSIFLISPPLINSMLICRNTNACEPLFAKLYLIGSVILLLFAQVPMISRYVNYFLILEIVLIPQIYSNSHKQMDRCLCLLSIALQAIILMLYLYFSYKSGVIDSSIGRVVPYHFFFEQ